MMNIYDDESLKQEVIYLHSLWHQGPPTRKPIPSPNFNLIHDPIQRPRPNYIPPSDLQLLSRYGAVTPQIISRNPNNPQNLYNNNKRPRPDSGREWPVNDVPQPPSTGSGWPEYRPCKKTRPISAEEKEKLAANMLQRDIHRTCREFFGRKSGEEDSSVAGGDESEIDEGDEDQSLEKEESSSSKEFQFLSRVFEENVKLKEYYEKNTGNGEFWCLVCGGIGEKSCRKFKSCLALIQHSLTIHKTDLKIQHRALAQVVCNVLGWDVNNPVVSSQKDSQTVVEGASEPPSDSKIPQEKQQVMSVEEHAKAAVLQMQQNASEALKDIFVKDGTGAADGTEENGDENLSEELELISKVFSENVELKSYYEKNYEGGAFICLVCCAATDKKMLKRFKHCYGVVQHCTKVPKMKIRAHKVFAQFVCELLGWDFELLPRRVMKGVASLAISNANENNENTSSMVEEHMCEDKAGNPQDNNEAEACVEA
ncbi:hypothetical protein ISN45_At01g069620 [Arabidopsis thaliana x Arabidopsis arenosa]|jgi:hypothetical protein|uniref:Uncharacterized protein At1g78810 n=3 Tax=Arabidopsis TaxID=3701 RepID=Q8W461_ARATH|nr:uncharacterized protein AT1G78810 [Arabidopsis thaliana]KAG7652198.1 hypothetical protein ISN45_At01g069620 [Arabidopsis thaliana x Arabidopsis arenosa]AAL32904.1 Unknown protein [Arabidopsis thaliana]AAM91153.1 unknown protein [Arabidopsis thaliana]AEE36156.1 hypothetical protein AT1G78810 [Arabidopsis thaliana]OAP11825.1 hypothetical protein AXX17_AT1G73470 [Arabidopsis thaliana]|eukprot:NP_178002.2 hypothetical protein AT1G78810 [Arabidopsis thaliana]